METDANASGIQTWLFGSVRVTNDHKPNTPFSDFLQPCGVAPYAAKLGIGSVDTKSGHSFTEQYDPGLIPNAGSFTTRGLLLLKHASKDLR